MTILEASGKQEPEVKEAPAGPLEEVRAMWPTCLCLLPQEAQLLNPQSPKIVFLVKGNSHPTPHPHVQMEKLQCFLKLVVSVSSILGVGGPASLPELSTPPTPG